MFAQCIKALVGQKNNSKESDFWKRITLSKSFLAHVAEALEMVFLCSGDSCEINCPAYPNLPDFSISLFHGLTNYHK